MSGKSKLVVIGGGISGITTAIEAAQAGSEVVLVEKEPTLGGRVLRMNKYFPKLCPPICGLEINLRAIKTCPDISVLTNAEVTAISGQAGDFEVTIKQNPGYVNDNCVLCDECSKVCPAERPSTMNYGMDTTKAIYLPNDMGYPARYTLDRAACVGGECKKCAEACKYNAIDLDDKGATITEKAGAVVVATGWAPYDASNMENLGYGKAKNVVTNVMMERLASVSGPTHGKILRPSDQAEPKSVAFVQCAGSRDDNYLKYCSGVCCMASLKQASYVREQYPDAKVYIFFIDIRTPGRFEDFYQARQEDENIILLKGKVAEVTEDPGTGEVQVVAEDTLSGKKITQKVDLVVLATGMVPQGLTASLPGALAKDEYGFLLAEQPVEGIFAAGVAKRPVDVASSNRDATGTALKAIQKLAR